MARYYANNPQPDHAYFSFGNAFLGGVQQAQNNQRQNALLDMEKQQFGMQQQRFAMDQDQYLRGIQADQAAGQQAASEREALASLLESEGLPVEWANLPRDQLADMLERHEENQKPAMPDYKVVGDQLLQIGPDGVSVAHTAPQRASADQKPVLTDVALPDGRLQKQWIVPGQSQGTPVGSPTSSRNTQISNKDLVTARNKLNQVKLARQQLKNAREKFAALKGTFSAGKGQGWVPTPRGEAFDKSIDLMRGTLTSLTRTPGVGAMSDYETRLDQAKFPSRGDYESVSEDNLNQLDAMLNAVEVGYSDLIADGPVQDEGSKPQASGGKVIDFSELPD